MPKNRDNSGTTTLSIVGSDSVLWISSGQRRGSPAVALNG
jgi:hypothetical protein